MRTTREHSYYLGGGTTIPTADGNRHQHPEYSEDHRAIALHLLAAAEDGDRTNRLAAAQVHATLAQATPKKPSDGTVCEEHAIRMQSGVIAHLYPDPTDAEAFDLVDVFDVHGKHIGVRDTCVRMTKGKMSRFDVCDSVLYQWGFERLGLWSDCGHATFTAEVKYTGTI